MHDSARVHGVVAKLVPGGDGGLAHLSNSELLANTRVESSTSARVGDVRARNRKGLPNQRPRNLATQPATLTLDSRVLRPRKTQGRRDRPVDIHELNSNTRKMPRRNGISRVSGLRCAPRTMASHDTIYEHAALYDLAFSYRNYEVETRCLRQMYERRRGRAPRSFLELAAGPAGHAIEMVASGLEVVALDIAPEMAAHARDRAKARDFTLPYAVADMVAFSPPGDFDLVACLLCSASYLLTDEAVLSHFASVRASLAPGGMYVLELTHPSELVGGPRPKHAWKMGDATGQLEIVWGGDPASAVGGIWLADVSLVYRPFDGSSPIVVQDAARQRGFTHAEFVGLAQQSGFVVEATLGGFDESIELDSPHATRMMVLLRSAG